ncbi:transmembrane protein 106A isoform X2 [Cuculus canorus]|uniref:transmembrane protein 106A isoform X2 n=1 Tax=Cuculus canorus TaxID=55661 RepID=UPI0023AA4402|nr:transmembrane protein 106A isoform X2 [Cuculus canorus]
MSGKLSRLWKTLDKKKSEGKLILPRQLDDEDEIASYASINDSAVSCVGPARQSCVNCPTCQGTGRIPREQEEQLVALIPYGDQRLKPRQTKFYVCLAVTICLLTTSLSIFFLFPRGATVLPAGLSASSVSFDATTTSIDLNMTNVLNVTNNNFCGVTVVQLEAEVLHQSLVVGKATTTTLLSMSPLQSSQIYYTVTGKIVDDTTYKICTWMKVKVHNILLHIEGTIMYTYLSLSEQVIFEDYQYVDCRGNATLPQPLRQRPP